MMRIPEPEQFLAELAQRPGLAELVARLKDPGDALPRVLVVGGVVRDLLAGRGGPVDIDLLVEGPLAPVLGRLDGVVAPHERFGTATAELGGVRVDVAEARTETYAQPGALPEVRPASAEADLRRRDFTVNAIAVELAGERAGDVLAFPGAFEDLEHGRLAALHDRSFLDDPTRLLRLARYRGRLGFEIAEGTRGLAEAALAGGALETVSGTRLGNELRLLAEEPDPVAAFAALAELGIDTALEPGFGLGGPDSDAANTLRTALSALPPDGRRDLLALAGASQRVPAPKLRTLLDRLAFSAPDREAVLEAAARSPSIAAALDVAVKPSQIADAVGVSATEAIALASALSSGAARQNALRWLTELRHADTAISGDDITAAGIPEGPAIGAGLKAARDAMLDGDAPDRERQLRIAVDAARSGLG